jgi:hypothetical protein
MADVMWVIGAQGQAARWRIWVGVVGRVCLWFTIAAVTLAVIGLSVVAVLALAHHAAPAGGGG